MTQSFAKIWGVNNEIYSNDICSVNILSLKKGGTCSLHVHQFKHNLFYVISGKLKIHTELGDSILSSGQSFVILPNTKHLFAALEETIAVEVMFVKYDHADIKREKVGFVDPGIAEEGS